MLQANSRLPRIPRSLLELHHVFVADDRPFTAAARLLQALWREERGFAVGASDNRLLGSYLTPADGQRGANFLSPELAALVRRELALLDRRARVDRTRLLHNLLTSQALCFNLFGPLKLNPSLAPTAPAADPPSHGNDTRHLHCRPVGSPYRTPVLQRRSRPTTRDSQMRKAGIMPPCNALKSDAEKSGVLAGWPIQPPPRAPAQIPPLNPLSHRIRGHIRASHDRARTAPFCHR